MLSIGKLAAGQQRYYTDTFPGVDEYYGEAGRVGGVWHGAGAALLGLDGAVDPVVLGRVLEFRDPESGDRLTGPRSVPKVPGFDLCFRAPKSVSVLEALAQPDIAAVVRDAHCVAVAAAVGYLEREATRARRGHGGVDVVAGDGLTAAAFTHSTSRAGDPHLHTHVLVANVTRRADGVWSALDGRALYVHAKTAGVLYESQLRHELSARLGVSWGPVVNGIADLDGIDTPVLKAFSRRRAQIETALKTQGAHSARAAQVAALTTRPAKDPFATPAQLREEWRARAAALGLDGFALGGVVGRVTDPVDRVQREEVTVWLAGPIGLTASRSSFGRRDVLQALAGLIPAGVPVARLEMMADRVLADPRFVGLDPGPGVILRRDRGGLVTAPTEQRWTTVELLTCERTLLETAARTVNSRAGLVAERATATAVGMHPFLSDEQTAMVQALTRSGDGVQVVVGVAGAGKTYALGVARQAWTAAGYHVTGTALAARAAQELTAGSGIPATTLTALMARLDDPRRGGLAPNTVVVVDEAAMVGTRTLAALAAHAERAGAKLVLVGDDRQLPSIDAGGAFTALAARVGAVELVANRRQSERWERSALTDLRAGRTETALAAYHAHGRRHRADNTEQLRTRLVADWTMAHTAGTDTVMLATRRADIDDLNRRAHHTRLTAGQLGPVVAATDTVEFRVGDDIAVTRNDHRHNLINGTRATITAPGPQPGSLTAVTRTGTRLDIPSDYIDAGHLHLGYATTIHKTQGATTDRTFILADDALYQEAGYVALSRGRHRNDLYTTHNPDQAAPGSDSDRHTHSRTVPDRPDHRDPLAAALGRSRAQQPVTPQLPPGAQHLPFSVPAPRPGAPDTVMPAPAPAPPVLPGRSLADLAGERRALSADNGVDARRREARLDRLITARTDALGQWAVTHPDPVTLNQLGPAPLQPARQT